MTECKKCGSTWTGVTICHCSGCHRSFNGLGAFDRHRTGSHAKGRYCLDPETAVNEVPDSSRFGERVFELNRRGRWGLAGEKPEYWNE